MENERVKTSDSKGETVKRRRRKRTKPALKRPDKLSGAQKLARLHRNIKTNLRKIAHDIWVNEWIVNIGLIASGLQLTVAFSYDTFVSYLSAFFKAAFIEACVWSLNRAIGWAGIVRLKKSGTVFLWGVLAIVMFISTRANLQYEYEKKLQQKNVLICQTQPTQCIPSSRNIDAYFSASEIGDAWLRGGLLPLLILGMIAARRLLQTSSATFEADETRRIFDALRAAEYRERIKAETAATARAVGVEP